MGKLDSLRITECPAAFAVFAAKHNALVDLLAAMRGEGGISVVMAENNAIVSGASGSMTQGEFNTMLAAACGELDDMIRSGCLQSAVEDVSSFVVADAIAAIPTTSLDTCTGTVTVLTT